MHELANIDHLSNSNKVYRHSKVVQCKRFPTKVRTSAILKDLESLKTCYNREKYKTNLMNLNLTNHKNVYRKQINEQIK